jgi:multiple sugar transport system substrate-binding protein
MRNRRSTRIAALSVLVVCATALLGATAASSETKASPKVRITVNALPPATDAVGRKNFLADVAAFERLNPSIDVVPREGKMDPQTFQARLAGGQLENVFYVYFTDPATLIAKRQAADITRYLSEFPVVKQIDPKLMRVFSDGRGRVYGVPWTNYSLGLLYSRPLFRRAGLDPNRPPTTWAAVRAAAKRIAGLGNDIVGYGDYSKNNTGGWHFTAELYSLGGAIAVKDGSRWKAAFNNTLGRQVLQQLHDMRWVDDSMGSRQLLEWADLLQMMGGGKLGMYIGTSDNIPTIVGQFKGNYADYGLGPMPGGRGTLAGGDGFLFNVKNTPAQIEAGLKWVTFAFTNPNRIGLQNARAAAAGLPVGLPQPFIWKAGTQGASKQEAATKKHANVPARNYTPFLSGAAKIPIKLEPPQAQRIYAVLDTAMQKVLTDKDADIGQLLSDAESQVNSILVSVT